MDTAKTATANYVIQYSIAFDQVGVGSDFTNTVIIIDGINYTMSAFPTSFWWNDASIHTFVFQSPLIVDSGAKQYNWTSTSGLSTLQSDAITVTGSGNIVGNYATLVHNVAVTSVAVAPSVVCQGYDCEIEVSVADTGDYAETFNVTLYASMPATGNITAVYTFVNVTLNSKDSTMLLFNWNTTGFHKGNYTISVYAEPVSGEMNTSDNILEGDWIMITSIGDINADGMVNVRDVYAVARAFGTSLFPPNPPNRSYNPNCDINHDGKVDIKDYYLVCKHYGEADPKTP